MRAVEHRLTPHHDLAHLGAAARVQEMHGADALELVRPRRGVGGRREKRQVDERIDAFGGEDFRERSSAAACVRRCRTPGFLAGVRGG